MKRLDGELLTTKEYWRELNIRTLVRRVTEDKGLDEEEQQEAREELEEKTNDEIKDLLWRAIF